MDTEIALVGHTPFTTDCKIFGTINEFEKLILEANLYRVALSSGHSGGGKCLPKVFQLE
jgi:nickel-dependent lactate racemase